MLTQFKTAYALRAIKAAVRRGDWLVDPHLLKRISVRGIALDDVEAALRSADAIEPYGMLPLNPGGEGWRLYGNDDEGRRIGIGVELMDERKQLLVITAFFRQVRR